jgi:hypothetical protein
VVLNCEATARQIPFLVGPEVATTGNPGALHQFDAIKVATVVKANGGMAHFMLRVELDAADANLHRNQVQESKRTAGEWSAINLAA